MIAIGGNRHRLLSLFVGGVLATAGCGGDSLAPFEPEIASAANSFQFQVTALSGVTRTVDYDWQNSGTIANVNQATSLSGGSAVLTIRDGAGAEVYSRALTDNGTFQTATGAAGTWRIRVRLENATGAVNFRVQRP